MDAQRKFYLTKNGLGRIKRDLQKLKEIRTFRAKSGTPPVLHSEDLNLEYLSFQEDLEFLESKIEELEHILKNFEIIKFPSRRERNKVYLGAQVKLEDDGLLKEFQIVGTIETNPSQNKISNESPIGKVLLGKKIGDNVIIKTPTASHSYKIIDIKYTKEE